MSEFFVYPEDMSDYEDTNEITINSKENNVFTALKYSGIENETNKEKKNIENNKNNVNEISINKPRT